MARGTGTKEKNRTKNGANLGFEQKLWQAADKLRGSMDASDYKHVVLGLIFLKYISDAFEAKHTELAAQKQQAEHGQVEAPQPQIPESMGGMVTLA